MESQREVGGRGSHPATMSLKDQLADPERDSNDPIAAMRETHGSGLVNTRTSDREDEYKQRRIKRLISPERGDAFSGKTPARSYADIMKERMLAQEEKTIHQAIAKKKEDGDIGAANKKRRRWDAGEASARPQAVLGRHPAVRVLGRLREGLGRLQGDSGRPPAALVRHRAGLGRPPAVSGRLQ